MTTAYYFVGIWRISKIFKKLILNLDYMSIEVEENAYRLLSAIIIQSTGTSG